jgi:hypothetical protein
MITPFKSRWNGAHRAYSNNPERFLSVDGSVETWSRELTRKEDLPVEISALLPEYFEGFPYCVYTPALESPVAADESYVLLEGTNLVVARRSLAGVSVFQADLEAIGALETETALLQSSITFFPLGGQPQVVPFNTVVEDLFSPILGAYLEVHGATLDEAAQFRSVHPDPFDDLVTRDYKYHAYATSVLAGERVRGRFYHPTETVHGLFNGSRLIPSYLLAATGSMLYAFSEKAPFRDLDKTSYGLVVRYLPLSANLSVGQRALKGSNRYHMTVLQSGEARFEFPLEVAIAGEFDAFLENLELPASVQDLDRKVG